MTARRLTFAIGLLAGLALGAVIYGPAKLAIVLLVAAVLLVVVALTIQPREPRT